MAVPRKRLQCGVRSSLDSSRWIKLSKRLDDFRFGPPVTRSSQILPAKSKENNFDDDDLSFAKIGARKCSGRTLERSKRKQHVQTTEKKLQRKLSNLFPNLEAEIPHEVYEKFVNFSGLAKESIESHRTSLNEELKSMPDESMNGKIEEPGKPVRDELPALVKGRKKKKKTDLLSLTTLDPFRSFLKRINYSSEKKSIKIDLKSTQEQETNERQIAQEFCQWLETIGSEDSDRTPSVDQILTLFGMNIELEKSQTEIEEVKIKPQIVTKTSRKTTSIPKKLEFIRYPYGTKKSEDRNLEDSGEIRDKSEILPNELDVEMAKLHSCNSLVSFIARNNLKTPKFLPTIFPSSNETPFADLKADRIRKSHGFYTC